MEDFFSWISKFGPGSSIILVLLVSIIVVLVKSQTIIDLFNWISRRKVVRSCGDCLLIIFGIREKYESEIYITNKNILKLQMTYFEQKIQEIILWLIQSFHEDMERFGKDAPLSLKIAQSKNYEEALKNAIFTVKDEIRRSFKENGFYTLSEIEYNCYIKSKVNTFISIMNSYLSTYYTHCEPIVSLKYTLDKLDLNKLTNLVLDLFGNAKSIFEDSVEKTEELKLQLKNEIDKFIENSH